MLQRSNASSLTEWIQTHLGPLLVAFVVFVLPAIRAAFAAKKQRDELKQKGGTEQEVPPGRKAWRDLLEGVEPDQPPPTMRAAPPPIPSPEEESLEEDPQPALVALPSSAMEPAQEVMAEDFIASRERQESQRQEQVSAAEYVASSPYRAGVAPQEASAVPVLARPPAPAPSAAERWLFPNAPARDRRAAMRRAIVLREVLGPPVGLR